MATNEKTAGADAEQANGTKGLLRRTGAAIRDYFDLNLRAKRSEERKKKKEDLAQQYHKIKEEIQRERAADAARRAAESAAKLNKAIEDAAREVLESYGIKGADLENAASAVVRKFQEAAIKSAKERWEAEKGQDTENKA